MRQAQPALSRRKNNLRCKWFPMSARALRLPRGSGWAMRSRFTIDFRKQSGGRDPISPGRRWGLGARSRQTRPMHTDSLVGTPEERIAQLEFENDILREVVEALKAGSLESMTGGEKTLAINALRQKTGRPLKELAVFSRISKSSYEYNRCSLEKPDKYTDVRAADNRGVCRAERGEWIPLRPLGDSNPGEPHRHIGKGDRAHHGRGGSSLNTTRSRGAGTAPMPERSAKPLLSGQEEFPYGCPRPPVAHEHNRVRPARWRKDAPVPYSIASTAHWPRGRLSRVSSWQIQAC